MRRLARLSPCSARAGRAPSRSLSAAFSFSFPTMAAAHPPAAAVGGGATSIAYAQPVTTDATAATVEELHEAAALFLEDDPSTFVFERCLGGVNNKVYRLSVGERKYVLRIYNNGFNEARVRYEHRVLRELSSHTFSFFTPSLIPVLGSGGADTYATLSSGASHACMFVAIPGGGAAGTLPAAHNIGRATAELVEGMRGMPALDLPLPNPVYRDVYGAHSKLTRELFYAAVAWPEFNTPEVKPHMDFLLAELAKAEDLVVRCTDQRLPMSQIHADLHFDNILARGDEVTGILDFEFTAHDWTVMEIAVGLSKYLSVKDAGAYLEAWVDGYAAGGGRLTQVEAALLPELLILRILSNVVYFVGRAVAQEDSTAPLTSRADIYAKRIRWVWEKQDWMVDMVRSKLVV